jgi:hypothetical protein
MALEPLPPPWLLTPPLGWLGLLGIKSGGRQPGHAAPDMVPTIDMERFYRAGSRNVLANVGGIANTNNVDATFGTVPQGKVWLLDYAVIASQTALGVAAGVVCGVVFYNGGGLRQALGLSSLRFLTGELAIASIQGPIIMGPNESLAIFSTAAAAPTAFNWRASAFGTEVSA